VSPTTPRALPARSSPSPAPCAAEDRHRRRTRRGLAALLGGAAALHVVAPTPFERMVPRWLPGSRSAWNLGSAAAEGISAALLASRRTSRLGGVVAASTLTVVFVANVQAVVDGGMRGLPGWLATRRAAILRLPLQVPLVWWSWRLARVERSGDG
jgi:uncharacterized membrane protein